jgi:phage portal protein BeeE
MNNPAAAPWDEPKIAGDFVVRLRNGSFTDRIDALAADRAALWDRVSGAAFLTLNEKREGGLRPGERRGPLG